MIRKLFTIFATVLLAACSNHTDEPVRRPGETIEPSAPDISHELADDAQRVALTDTVVAYDNGGVIFGRTADNVLFAIDISSGWRCDYNPTQNILKINGLNLSIKDSYVAKNQDRTTWYVATPTTSPEKRILFVTRF